MSAPRPTLTQVRTVLYRQLPTPHTQEHALWLHAIFSAFSDLASKRRKTNGASYLRSPGCLAVCDLIAINHEFVIECASKMTGEPI